MAEDGDEQSEVAEATADVLHLADVLDDDRLHAEYGQLNVRAMARLPAGPGVQVEAFAELRYAGEETATTIRVDRPDLAAMHQRFAEARGEPSPADQVQVVRLRVRRSRG